MKLHGTMRVNNKGNLEIGDCDTTELAREYGTPLYVLDEKHFRQNCSDYYQAFTEPFGADVIYAGKTLLTLAVCRMIDEQGLSLDVVSGGELYTAIRANFPMQRVYFHGNNKTTEEIKLALEYKIGRFMVDNLYELELLNKLSREMRTNAEVLLRLTPGVDAHTHDYIRTGHIDSKFGLVIENGQAMAGVERALELENIELKGFHCHIGSQIYELESYAHTAEVMMTFINSVRRKTGFVASELDLGGGLGIYYTAEDMPKSVREYAKLLMHAVKEQSERFDLPTPRVMVEPGRSIAGSAGTTLYRVGAIKDIPNIRKYIAVDGSMSDNLRPALYGAKYEACAANRMNEEPTQVVSVAGKCCESGDMLVWDLPLSTVQSGDILAVSCTGAYGYSMSMNYNRLCRPAMVLVNDGQVDLIIRRESYVDITRNDLIPERLKNKIVNLAQAR